MNRRREATPRERYTLGERVKSDHARGWIAATSGESLDWTRSAEWIAGWIEGDAYDLSPRLAAAAAEQS